MRILNAFLYCGGAVSLAACAIHPLQDNVTDLPLHDVIFKIQCEAHDAERDIMDRMGLSGLRPRLKRYNASIAKINSALKPFKTTDKELIKLQKELVAEKSQISINLAAVIQLASANPQPPGLKEEAERLKKQISDHFTKISNYYQKLWKNSEKQAPILNDLQKIQVAKANDKEVAKLLSFYGNQMAYLFRFNIKETDVANVTNLSYKFPVPNGTFTIGLAGGDTKDRESDRNVKIVIGFDELDDLDCIDGPPDVYGLRTVHYPIKGSIGVAEVIDQYLAIQADKEGKLDKGQSYTDQISFTTTLSGSINPSFTISPTLLSQVSGTLSAGITRKDLHSVFISLAPPGSDAVVEQVTKVQIVKEDDVFLPPQ